MKEKDSGARGVKVAEDREKLQIAAYFDGELSAAAQLPFKRRIDVGDPAVLTELESLSFVRDQARENMRQRLIEAQLDGDALWERIEAKIADAEFGSETRKIVTLPPPPNAPFLAKSPWFRPQLLGGIAAVVAVTVYFGLENFPRLSEQAAVGGGQREENLACQNGRDGRPLAVSYNESDRGEHFQHPFLAQSLLPLARGAQQFQCLAETDEYLGSGGRSQSSAPEFDSSRAGKPFKILSSGEFQPPLVWVANRAD